MMMTMLATASRFLLLTERIEQKPLLRTRFTNQAYFVLAAIFDLITQGVLGVENQRLVVRDAARLAGLPDSLGDLKRDIQKTQPDNALETSLSLITSWDVANSTYDAVGAELLEEKRVERVIFQNNLKPHVIYEPTSSSRQQMVDWLTNQLTTLTPTQSGLDLIVILLQLDAMKWVVSDADDRVANFKQRVSTNGQFLSRQAIAETAAEVITQKRFWLDSWLS